MKQLITIIQLLLLPCMIQAQEVKIVTVDSVNYIVSTDTLANGTIQIVYQPAGNLKNDLERQRDDLEREIQHSEAKIERIRAEIKEKRQRVKEMQKAIDSIEKNAQPRDIDTGRTELSPPPSEPQKPPVKKKKKRKKN